MLRMPRTLTYDLQPYGTVTLGNLRQSPNRNNPNATDVTGDVIAGTETAYLFGHTRTKPASGVRTIYGVKQHELDSGHIVRVAM